MSSSSLRTRRQAGFTIVELLVAVALISLVILAVFAFYTSSSRAVQQQTDGLRAFERVAFSLDVLRADLQMAGFLGTPNASLDPDDYGEEFVMCHDPLVDNTVRHGGGTQLGAIVFREGAVPAANFTGAWGSLSPSGQLPMEVELVGAFQLPEMVQVRAAAGSLLTIEEPPVVANYLDITGTEQLRFYRELLDGGMVALVNRFGGVVLAEVGAQPSVVGELDLRQVPSPVPGRGERCNFGVGGEIADDNTRLAILHRVRYRLEPLVEGGPDDGVPIIRPALVRSVIAYEGGVEPREIERAILARNVVDLQFGIARDTSPPALPPTVNNAPFGVGGMGIEEGELGEMSRADVITRTANCPHRTRHVYVQLSVRLDTALEQIPEQPGEVIRSTIDINGERARVVTFRTEVPLMNFVLSDLTGPPAC